MVVLFNQHTHGKNGETTLLGFGQDETSISGKDYKEKKCTHFLSLAVILIGPSRKSTESFTGLTLLSWLLQTDIGKACQLSAAIVLQRCFTTGQLSKKTNFPHVSDHGMGEEGTFLVQGGKESTQHCTEVLVLHIAWAGPLLPFSLSHIAQAYGLHLHYIAFYEVSLKKIKHIFPVFHKNWVILIQCCSILLDNQSVKLVNRM